MNTLAVVCFAIPVIGFGKAVIQNWETVKWVHTMPIKITKISKKRETWRMKDGKEINCKEMEDQHLINAIKMVARNGSKPSYLGDFKVTALWKKLAGEAKRRKWTIIHLSTPKEIHGRKEYVDVCTPTPQSMLSTNMQISEWDSRLDE